MRTVLITGANRGLGKGFCKHYLKSDYTVIACYRSTSNNQELLRLLEEYGEQLILVELDVTNTDQIKKIAQEWSDKPIDILINNAGIYSVEGNDYKISETPWLKIYATNTVAPYLMAHAFKNSIALSKEKKIINITSYMASIELNTSGGEAPYRASKAALNAVTKELAIELQAKKIIVVAVSPGWVQTDMGGTKAPLTVAASVDHITRAIESLSLKNSGAFLEHTGEKLAW